MENSTKAQDWPNLSKYQKAKCDSLNDRKQVVFMGDSIMTEF
jgi:hypothetical protein